MRRCHMTSSTWYLFPTRGLKKRMVASRKHERASPTGITPTQQAKRMSKSPMSLSKGVGKRRLDFTSSAGTEWSTSKEVCLVEYIVSNFMLSPGPKRRLVSFGKMHQSS